MSFRPIRLLPSMTSRASVTSLVCGLLAFVLCWLPVLGILTFPLGIMALVAAFIGYFDARRRSVAGRGLAVAGLICGAIGLAFATWWLVDFVDAFKAPEFRRDIQPLRDLLDVEHPSRP